MPLLQEYKQEEFLERYYNCPHFRAFYERGRAEGLSYEQIMVTIAIEMSKVKDQIVQGCVDEKMREPMRIVVSVQEAGKILETIHLKSKDPNA